MHAGGRGCEGRKERGCHLPVLPASSHDAMGAAKDEIETDWLERPTERLGIVSSALSLKDRDGSPPLTERFEPSAAAAAREDEEVDEVEDFFSGFHRLPSVQNT